MRQSDLYFQHPCRDFRQTHEALRLRKTDDGVRITYKGPIIDSRTKMRRELELPVGRDAGDFDQFRELLTILGFVAVRGVEKTQGRPRRPAVHLRRSCFMSCCKWLDF